MRTKMLAVSFLVIIITIVGGVGCGTVEEIKDKVVDAIATPDPTSSPVPDTTASTTPSAIATPQPAATDQTAPVDLNLVS